MFDAKLLSKSIRAKKKKAMNADPELVHTDAKPDLNPMDMYNVDQKAQIEETVGSPKKIDAEDKQYDDEAQQDSMSHEPMQSKEMPKDHGRMAYGGEVEEHSDPSMPSMDMEREVAGSSGTRSEMDQRIGDKFQAGSKHMNGDSMPSLGESEEIGGTMDAENEMKRRTMARKMRLASYMDSLDI